MPTRPRIAVVAVVARMTDPSVRRSTKENKMERQWVVVEDGRLIRTFGREVGSRDAARREARKRKRLWPGAKAVLMSQDEIDRLD